MMMVGLKEEQTIILTVMQMSDQLEYDKGTSEILSHVSWHLCIGP